MKLGLYAENAYRVDFPAGEFDFVEENVQTLLMPEADDATFAAHKGELLKTAEPIKVANRFLPADLKPVGPSVNRERLTKWCEVALRRAGEMGLELIVWGSGVSRRLENDFPREQAREQFIEAVSIAASMAQKAGVTIVIEPVCRHDSNFIRSLAEGADIVEAVNHPAIRLLADFWHMHIEGEAPEEMIRFAPILEHVHLSEWGMDRGQPGRRGDDFGPYLRALRESGYDKGLVIESFWNDVATESRSGLVELRRQVRAAGWDV